MQIVFAKEVSCLKVILFHDVFYYKLFVVVTDKEVSRGRFALKNFYCESSERVVTNQISKRTYFMLL